MSLHGAQDLASVPPYPAAQTHEGVALSAQAQPVLPVQVSLVVPVEQSIGASGSGVGAGADFSLQTGLLAFDVPHSHLLSVNLHACSPSFSHVRS